MVMIAANVCALTAKDLCRTDTLTLSWLIDKLKLFDF
jgi:hypothetical protein